MQSTRLPYKSDVHDHPIYARVSWSNQGEQSARPIAILYHGGGLVVGSSEMIPKPQIQHLTSHGFVVVAPNYRLCPQVTGAEAFSDCEDAYNWTISSLPGLLESQHSIHLDTSKVVTAGHSSGGTLATHVGACNPSIKAVTAFYPTLYASDHDTSGHKPFSLPPFGQLPDFEPTEADWAAIIPSNCQVSESGLAVPGQLPPPRNRWQAQLLKKGRWLSTLCPDGQFARIDPLTRLHANWPAVMIVQGDADKIPGSGLDLAQRACNDMRTAGVGQVSLEIVQGADHMFDMPLSSADVGPKWDAVVKGLDWLVNHV